MVSSTQYTGVWQTLGDNERQGILVYGSPWGCKESDTIVQLSIRQMRKLPHGLKAVAPFAVSFSVWPVSESRAPSLVFCGNSGSGSMERVVT